MASDDAKAVFGGRTGDEAVKGDHLLLRAGADDGAVPFRLDDDVGHVLTAERLPGVAEVDHGRPALEVGGGAVQGEALVVGNGKDLVVGQEAGVVDRRVMVEGLDDYLVLVGDARVADVDEAVGRARQEDGGVAGMEVQLPSVSFSHSLETNTAARLAAWCVAE